MKRALRTLKWTHIGLFSIASFLLVLSLVPGVEWASFERERGVGPASYELKASLEASGFEYSLTARSSGGGGMIGGLGGLNRTIGPVSKAYPEVRGEVLENLGVIYDSYKAKSYIYELVMEEPPAGSGVSWPGPGSPSVQINVTLSSDLVPYWPTFGTRTLTVTVELLKSDLHEMVGTELRPKLKVTVNRVIIRALTTYDTESGSLSGTPIVLKDSSKQLVLDEIGDRVDNRYEVRYPEGVEVAGLYVDIEASLNDYWDRPERSPLTGGANTINIRPVPVRTVIAIIGIPIAMPLIIISMVAGSVSTVLSSVKKRPHMVLSVIAALIAIIALAWFWTGVMGGVGLLSQRLEGAKEGLEVSWGSIIAALGCATLLTSSIIQVVWKRSLPTPSEEDKPIFKRV